jgi:hypothetical protein
VSRKAAKNLVVDGSFRRWFRPKEAKEFTGLSRSKLYELIRSGAIKSVSIKRKGAVRGIRLIDRQSCLEFFESFET